MSKVFIIRRGNKTVSVPHRNNFYVIGFKNKMVARNVLHNLHPEPQLDIIRNENIDISKDIINNGYTMDTPFIIDVDATLFMQKLKGDSMNPMNDGGYHLDQMQEFEFITLPIVRNLGVVMPINLIDETVEEFVFKSIVLDPLYN